MIADGVHKRACVPLVDDGAIVAALQIVWALRGRAATACAPGPAEERRRSFMSAAACALLTELRIFFAAAGRAMLFICVSMTFVILAGGRTLYYPKAVPECVMQTI